MKRFLSWLALAASATTFVACGGDDVVSDGAAAPPAAGSISGQVVETDSDAPLANARVTVGLRSVQTDGQGRFAVDGLAPGEPVAVRVEADGHGANVAHVTPSAAGPATVRVRLIQLAASQAFAATEPALLTGAGSPARVALPANALVDAATGAAAQGTVSASLTDIDPATDPGRMPGNFSTVEAGAERRIESFGAIKVDLRDGAGRRLNLAPGKTATVRIPLSTRSPNPPTTVPLFHFDEVTGHWVQEGTAMLKTGDGAPYYEGTVSHFSYWNADMVADTVVLEGCVVDSAGRPVSGVQVSSSGVDYSGSNATFTDRDGRFAIEVRKDATTAVWGATGDRITAVNEVAMGGFGGAMKGCMVLEAATSPIPGRLAPKVMQSPRSTAVLAGDGAMFNAVVEGTQPMTYEWRRNGQVLPGSNSSVLFVYPTSSADHGAVFTVTATNVAGTATSGPATLSVSTTATAPTLLLPPWPTTVASGQTARFAVSVNGSAPLSFQWHRNGQPIPGATASGHAFTATDADHGAVYSVVVTNGVGTLTSPGAKLTVIAANAAPVIASGPFSRVVDVGDDVTFSVQAHGSGTLAYQWQRNGVDLAGATGATLTVNDVTPADHLATFRVVVTNAAGSTASAFATLTVNQGPTDQKDRILQLFTRWGSGLTAAGAALEVVDEDFRMLPAGEVCSTGTVAATLDGSPAPAAGQALPLGSHTLETTYTACDTSGGLYEGRSRIAYQFNDATLRTGTAEATVTDFVQQGTDFEGGDAFLRANGQARIEVDGSVAGATETSRVRFIPAAGFSLVDVASGVASTAVSGSLLMHNVLVGTAPSVLRQEFAAYTFAHAGVTYTFDGFVQFDFTTPGAATGSGTVTLTADGVPVARISGTGDGYGVEVLNGGLPASAAAGSSPTSVRGTPAMRVGPKGLQRSVRLR